MTDPFTAASPTYINARRLGARSGEAFELTYAGVPRWPLFAMGGAAWAVIALAVWAWWRVGR